jgi:hypothetical protein
MKAIDIRAQNARALRELLRQSQEAYAVSKDAQGSMNNWCVEDQPP